MTIFNISRLPRASWKGVSFYYKDSSISGGRKTVTNEYPNLDARYIEDLGKLEKTFDINACIDTNVSFAERDAFIAVLEDEGAGVLIHPAFGNINAVLKNYTLTDNTKSLGLCEFALNFEETSLNQSLQRVPGDRDKLSRLRAKINDLAMVKFEKNWQVVKNFKEGLDSANATLRSTATKLNYLSRTVKGSANTFSNFSTAINEIINSSTDLVQSPSVLGKKIKTAYNNLINAYGTSDELFQVLSKFFGYDGADRSGNGASSRQKAIKKNQEQIQNIFQTMALSSAYEAAVNSNFTTQDSLNAAIQTLEDGFNLLPANLDGETRSALQESRIAAIEVFNNLSVSLPKILTVTTQKTSLNMFIYSYYGSLDLKDTILALNNFGDTSEIEGEVRILSNV